MILIYAAHYYECACIITDAQQLNRRNQIESAIKSRASFQSFYCDITYFLLLRCSALFSTLTSPTFEFFLHARRMDMFTFHKFNVCGWHINHFSPINNCNDWMRNKIFKIYHRERAKKPRLSVNPGWIFSFSYTHTYTPYTHHKECHTQKSIQLAIVVFTVLRIVHV